MRSMALTRISTSRSATPSAPHAGSSSASDRPRRVPEVSGPPRTLAAPAPKHRPARREAQLLRDPRPESRLRDGAGPADSLGPATERDPHMIERPYVVVLAGGEGTRLASLTRALYGTDLPKQF